MAALPVDIDLWGLPLMLARQVDLGRGVTPREQRASTVVGVLQKTASSSDLVLLNWPIGKSGTESPE